MTKRMLNPSFPFLYAVSPTTAPENIQDHSHGHYEFSQEMLLQLTSFLQIPIWEMAFLSNLPYLLKTTIISCCCTIYVFATII